MRSDTLFIYKKYMSFLLSQYINVRTFAGLNGMK